jgi:hypothetical protein
MGVEKFEMVGMEKRTKNIFYFLGGAVGIISNNRVSHMFEVDADLVCPSGDGDTLK